MRHAATPRADRVFVYGTLRPGERNQHYLVTALHLGTCASDAAFTLLDTGAYPAALDTGDTALTGDVFDVDDATLAALDVLEDYPIHYTRRPIATAYGNAWIYLWIAARDPDWPTIAGGDWYQRDAPPNPMTQGNRAHQ